MIYFIPTPIGNIEDITVRSLNLLKKNQYFLCEDTRTTIKLFKLYDINIYEKIFYSLTSYTSELKFNKYIDLFKKFDFGVLSEAGTPGLSDPGKKIIEICWKLGINFEVLPGANALIPTVVSSNFDTSEFMFLGFLPTKKGRKTKILEILNSKIPVYIFESVHRIKKLLLEFKKVGFNGKIIVSREITKLYEQKVCDSIDVILEKFNDGEIKEKGEFVVGFKNL